MNAERRPADEPPGDQAPALSLRRRRRRALQIGLGITAVVIGIAVIYLIRDTLGAFVLGALLAFLINPLVDRLARIIPRALAIVIIFALLVVALAGLASIFVPLLTQEVSQLQSQAPHIVTAAQDQLARLQQGQRVTLFGFQIDLSQQAKNLNQKLGDFLFGQFGNAIGIGIFALNLLLQTLLTLIVAFLVSLDAHNITDFLRQLVPADYREDFDEIWPRVKSMLFGYLRGQLTVAAIIGIGVGVALWLEKMPYPFALGVLAGITALVPFIGPWIGAVPIELVALSSGLGEALLVGLTYLAITNVVLQFLFPRILGAAVRLPALMVIVAFLAGFSLAGILGMFIAIPVAATIAILFDHVYLRVYGTEP